MGRQRPSVGPIIAVVLGVCLVAAGLAVVGRDRIAAAVGSPAPRWRPGTAPSAPPILAAVSTGAQAPTTAGLTTVLRPLLADPGLGTHTAISVIDATTGESLFSGGGETASTPASTAKLITATTVLTARDPAYRLKTRAVAGTEPGDVVLIGAGDPTLAAGKVGTYPDAARLPDLAAQVKTALGDTQPTRVVVDSSLFEGPGFGPGWDDDIPTGGSAAAITSLMTDGGRVDPTRVRGSSKRYVQPDLAAGQAFATALGISGRVSAGKAPEGAKELGAVESPPLIRLVDMMLTESDNVIAECLARQVALARNERASFDGAAAAMRAVIGELGLTATEDGLVDGSGLSRTDRLTPSLLADILALATKSDRPQLRSVFGGLPVAGYSGTLRERYRSPGAGGAAAGLVRAKTGTLRRVSAIAGIVVDTDGRTLAFAVLADGVAVGQTATTASQQALDRIAAALATCGCR
jgi:D-alanyl-D-alanine carboxypeptidase/D-alanyl-D-alanine-endopeptidase (penicillin-binding protein 4)